MLVPASFAAIGMHGTFLASGQNKHSELWPLHHEIIQSRCGMKFTSCCNSSCNHHALAIASTLRAKSFLKLYNKGQHVSNGPPSSNPMQFILHFLQCKQQSSHDTCAYILVPHHMISQLPARGVIWYANVAILSQSVHAVLR